MKKLGLFIVFAFAIVVAVPGAYAQITEKNIKKEAKKAAKRISKEGWTLYDPSDDLRSVLINHYQNLQNEGAQELVGVASSFVMEKFGKQMATHSACIEYARQSTSLLISRAPIEWSQNAPEAGVLDKFYSAYESHLSSEIKRALTPSFSIIRSVNKNEMGPKVFDMQSFFIVNENDALKARLAAMNKAIDESGLSQEYASKLAEFVQGDFDVESHE